MFLVLLNNHYNDLFVNYKDTKKNRYPLDYGVFWAGYLEKSKSIAQYFSKMVNNYNEGKFSTTVEMFGKGRYLETKTPWNELIKEFETQYDMENKKAMNHAKAVWDSISFSFANNSEPKVCAFSK